MPVTVLHNRDNLGFAATVNRGLERTPGDVVVLNADTVVTAGWLDRLADAALSTARAAGAAHADVRIERLRGQHVVVRDRQLQTAVDT